jgi:DNA-binding NarL/FixJ family response regulator
MKRCLICDDHAMMRSALAGCVGMLWPDAEVVLATNFVEAQAKAAGASFDLIMCDLIMPGAKPMAGVAALLSAAPGVPVLIVTGNEEDELLLGLVESGIAGFVPKTASSDVIELAIRLALAGERYLPRRIAEIATAHATGQPLPAVSPPDSGARLTERQREVLRRIAGGETNKEIARVFNLSPATIKTHTAAIIAILGVANRAEAVARAQAEGMM